MDWANETYVRVYKRKTADHAVLRWEARALWPLLIMEADRAGVIATKHGSKGIAALLSLPREMVDAGLPELLEDGCIREIDGGRGYVIPNYMAAQETPQSDKQRKREEREKRRAIALAEELGAVTFRDISVTKPDTESQNVSETSRAVTPSHAASRSVTLSRSELSRSETNKESGRPDVVAEPVLFPDEPRAPSPAEQLAAVACAEINRLTGSAFEPTSKATLALCKALVKSKHTAEEALLVIRDKHAEWHSNAEMRKRLVPGTLLALSNFERYLDELRSRSPQNARGATFHTAPHPEPRRIKTLA